MGKSNKKLTEWASRFIFAVLLIIVYLLLSNFSEVKVAFNGFMRIMSPFLTGILISYLLYVPCKNIEKLYSKSKLKFLSNKARALSVLSVFLLLFLLIILAINFAIPPLFNSIVDLVNSVPMYYNNTVDAIQNASEDSLLKYFNIKEGLTDFANTSIVELTNMENLGKFAKSAAGIVGSVFNIFVSVISSLYILMDRTNILRFLNKLVGVTFKENTHAVIKKYFIKANEVFFRFIASKGLDCLINGIAISFILLILNVKYAFLFGLFAGIFNAIPFFGSAIACISIAVITIFTGGLNKAVTVIILLLIFQQIDANFIEPRIMKSSLKISPILVISGIIIGGAYFGVIGMFLAVPVITVLKIILLDLIEQRQIYKKREIPDETK